VIQFTIPGEVVAKGRPRFGNGRVFTPARTVAYERLVRVYARQAMAGLKPLEGPLQLSMVAIFAIPKAWTKARLATCLEAPEYVVKRPDLSNAVKAAEDGMNGIVWLDDDQVADLHIIKIYGAEPALHITVTPLPANAVRRM